MTNEHQQIDDKFNALIIYTPDNTKAVRGMPKVTSSQYFTKEAHKFLRRNREAIELLVHGFIVNEGSK